MRKSIIIAATAATLFAVPSLASASPMNSVDFDETITQDDLDLTTSEGASRLDERVRTKVRQLCRLGGRDSATQRLERQCRESALAATTPQIRLAIAEANAHRPRLASNETPSTADRADTPGA